MRVNSIEMSGSIFTVGDKAVVLKRIDNDKFLVSEDHFDCWNRPIKYTLNYINKKTSGRIEMSLKIDEHNIRNPKTPHKTTIILPISDDVTVARVAE